MRIYGNIAAMLATLSLLVLCSATSTWAQPLGFMAQPPQQKPQHSALSSAQGRFVFGQVSDSSEDRFMLDTLTGRLWRMTKRTDVGACLTSIPYRDADGQCSALPEELPEAGHEKVKRP